MENTQLDERVDTYIENAPLFAQPILAHLRKLMHQACPRAAETMKWRMPFFVQQGVIIAHLAAFKKHCVFGFWGRETKKVLAKDGLMAKTSMGPFANLTAMKDLPPDKALLSYMRHAADLIESGRRTQSIERRQKPVKRKQVQVPTELAAALKKNRLASKVFAEFSPSCRRDYCDWIASAKRPETKEKRLRQAISLISQAKPRYSKYDRQKQFSQ
jgi:uncharacterized protein YdeI (YjbR/CyaY-like superfamily)